MQDESRVVVRMISGSLEWPGDHSRYSAVLSCEGFSVLYRYFFWYWLQHAVFFRYRSSWGLAFIYASFPLLHCDVCLVTLVNPSANSPYESENETQSECEVICKPQIENIYYMINAELLGTLMRLLSVCYIHCRQPSHLILSFIHYVGSMGSVQLPTRLGELQCHWEAQSHPASPLNERMSWSHWYRWWSASRQSLINRLHESTTVTTDCSVSTDIRLLCLLLHSMDHNRLLWPGWLISGSFIYYCIQQIPTESSVQTGQFPLMSGSSVDCYIRQIRKGFFVQTLSFAPPPPPPPPPSPYYQAFVGRSIPYSFHCPCENYPGVVDPLHIWDIWARGTRGIVPTRLSTQRAF